MKFNVNTTSSSSICIVGFNNKMTVDFSGLFTPSKVGEGVINLGQGNGEKWAILLAQGAMEEGEAYSSDGSFVGTRGEVPAIENNGYLTDGIDVTVNTDNQGRLRGKFSVSSTQQVYFSKGNLQYIGSAATPYWKFAEEQYEYLGHNGQGSSAANVDRDLFGRGTSGYNNKHPWTTSSINSDYISDAFNNTNYDWGVYNAITNGGNTAGMWRTPTGDEFLYVFNSRSGDRYSQVVIDGIYGVVLLPDGWDSSLFKFTKLNGLTALSDPSDATVITLEEWKNAIEIHGAVFLPAASRRVGIEVKDDFRWGNYWLSTLTANGKSQYRYYYYYNNWIWPATGTTAITNGYSVRLVADVN